MSSSQQLYFVLGRLWLYERKPAGESHVPVGKLYLFLSEPVLEKVPQFLGSTSILHETRDISHSSLIHSARSSRRGALSHYHLPPFLSSRLFTHEDRRMYARLRLPVL